MVTEQVSAKPSLSPLKSAITYDQAAENSASRMHAQNREEKYALVHHVCIVFPFRREGTRQ
jgi:hypothetical protein